MTTTTSTPTTTPAPLRTPADIFATIIQAKATELGYVVYVNHMQDQPDRAIVCLDGRGKLNAHLMRGDHTGFDLVEVQVRARDHQDSGNVLPVLWEDVLKHVSATSVSGKIVQVISKSNTMGCMGQEPQTRRWRFNQSFLMTIV
jgi:hypothetical protein